MSASNLPPLCIKPSTRQRNIHFSSTCIVGSQLQKSTENASKGKNLQNIFDGRSQNYPIHLGHLHPIPTGPGPQPGFTETRGRCGRFNSRIWIILLWELNFTKLQTRECGDHHPELLPHCRVLLHPSHSWYWGDRVWEGNQTQNDNDDCENFVGLCGCGEYNLWWPNHC